MHSLPQLILFSCFISVITFNTLCGQSSNFVVLGLEEGLINTDVRSLLQDDDGNLWIGTIAGLTRYNGKSFDNFTQRDGLAEDWITTAFKDTRGNLWFGHWGGGITQYDTKSKKFIDTKVEDISDFRLIRAITGDSLGNVFFGTDGAGILQYDPSVDSFVILDELFSGKSISALCTDQFGKLWIGSDKGIVVYDIAGKSVTNELSGSSGFASDNIQCITRAMVDEIWVGTKDTGIIRLKNKPGNYYFSRESVSDILIADGLPSQNIASLYEDNQHTVWIGTKRHGIAQFVPVGSGSLAATGWFAKGNINIFSSKLEMKYYHAKCFLQDREKNIWMGSEIGLGRYMGELFRLYNQNDGLRSNLVWSILEDSEKNIWMGTSDGVTRFTFPLINEKKQYHSPFTKTYTLADGLPENIINALFEDKQGNVWMGTENSGVAVLLKASGKIAVYSTEQGISDNKIYSIADDTDGNIWLGTRKGACRIRLSAEAPAYQTSEKSKKKYRIKHHKQEIPPAEIHCYTTADGLGGEKIYKIHRDRKGNLWFGILGGELTVYNGKTFSTITDQESEGQKFILSIAEDKNGALWFGTYAEGILKYSPSFVTPLGEDSGTHVSFSSSNGEGQGGAWTSYTIKDGMSSNSPQFLICDEENNVWIGMALGIEKYDTKSKRFTLYGKRQGFLGLQTNENAIMRDNSANIWFGTIRGAVKFDPSKDKPNTIEPLTTFTGLKVFFEDFTFPPDSTFSHSQNYITFQTLAVCLTNPSEVRYQFWLEGVDKDWQPPTKENSNTYSNLSHGNYTLRVKACNNDGKWNTQPLIYNFIITPPFWRTWWFNMLGVLFLLAAIFIFIKWRERNLRKQKEKLKKLVVLRTKELNKAMTDVEKKNEEISKKNLQITESINYARRIQDAVLTPMEAVKKLLPESFIFYKPKDIVSGDFYWVHQVGDRIFFAAVDCTGHGVPGAFMSMIGNNLLDKIVKENHILQPSAILNHLNNEVERTLRTSEQNTETVAGSESVKDGMDIALCSFNPKSMHLDFAGAYNPLYIVRNGDVISLKGDRLPIGKSVVERTSGFQNQSVKLCKGDVIYIFSDGYADQKGGPERKKFYYANFKSLLIEIHKLPMEEQKKRLDERMRAWQGGVEQYDDMLIIGVEV